MLGPERALHTFDELHLLLGVHALHRHIVVAAFHAVVAVAGARRLTVVVALLAADVVAAVALVILGDDGRQAELLHGLCHTLLTGVPAHDGRLRLLHEVEVGAASGDGLVPAHQVLVLRGHKVGQVLDEMGLQLAIARQAELLILLLAEVVVLPLRGGALVATHVDIGIREDVAKLVEDILGKLHRLWVGHIEHI